MAVTKSDFDYMNTVANDTRYIAISIETKKKMLAIQIRL